jgi:hypothetical protein
VIALHESVTLCGFRLFRVAGMDLIIEIHMVVVLGA